MTMSCPSPVLGCAMRWTRENECGVPLDPLAPNSRIQTRNFVSVVATPQNSDSNTISLQNACTEFSTFYLTQARTTHWSLEVTMSIVEIGVLELVLDASLLESPDTPGDFIGWATANGLTQPNPNPKMLEIQSNNANAAECGLGGAGSAAVVRHLFSKTQNWVVSSAFNVNASDPFTIVLQGNAVNNPQWFPSFPNDTFPSWDPGGGSTSPDNIPDGPPPPVLPAGIDADPWSLDHQAAIQAGGPYAQITEGSYFETFNCEYVTTGS